MDYSQGKIYRLITDEPVPRVYIGATITSLDKRLSCHNAPDNDAVSKQISGICRIELIEEYPCKDVWELERREREHILRGREDTTIICLNKLLPAPTKEERKEYKKNWHIQNKERVSQKSKDWHQSHREEQLEKMKAYREANRDIINTKQREKIICECGRSVSRTHIIRHRESKIHLDLMSMKHLQPDN